jgi:heat shock protein HtpX
MYEQIAANKRKTVLLFLGAVVFLGLVGLAIGYLLGTGPWGLAVAVVIAVAMSWGSYFYGDRLVLASTKAREVTKEEQPRLHNLVEGLAIAAGLPKPRVYVVSEQAPNAFATGRDPEHASIAVTEGLLAIMNRVELEGVLAHELAHVQDRDILVGTVVSTLIGAAILMSEFFLNSWWWAGGRGRRGGGDGAGAGGLVLFAIGFVLMALAPLAGRAIKMSVSRNREYLADAQGVTLTRYPPGLIAALEKIAASPNVMVRANDATANLWLNQPSRVEGERTTRLEGLFSTHPPIGERIERLRDM